MINEKLIKKETNKIYSKGEDVGGLLDNASSIALTICEATGNIISSIDIFFEDLTATEEDYLQENRLLSNNKEDINKDNKSKTVSGGGEDVIVGASIKGKELTEEALNDIVSIAEGTGDMAEDGLEAIGNVLQGIGDVLGGFDF